MLHIVEIVIKTVSGRQYTPRNLTQASASAAIQGKEIKIMSADLNGQASRVLVV